MLSKLWAGIVLSLHRLLVVHGAGTGDPRCPCIGNRLLTYYERTLGGKECAVYTHINGTEYCYPLDYGQSSCKLHDKLLPPSCASHDGKRLVNAPEWCDDMWCYVDKANCADLDVPQLSVYFAKSDVYYSYQTCGGEDMFAKHSQAAKKTAPELVEVIEGYSKTLQAEVEAAFALLADPESVNECTHWHSTCPCESCEVSEEWSAQTKPRSDLLLDFSITGLTLATKYNDGSDRVERAQCMTQILASQYKSVRRREYNDKNRIAYLYFGDQATGGLAMWPGMQWCTDSYDARLRPWYAAATTGPKDLILLLDMSGSMYASGLRDPAVRAAQAVIYTLTANDYASVVLYNSRAVAYDGVDNLHPMTAKNQELIREWLDDQQANGGTNFRKGFQKVETILRNSRQDGKTSGCIRTVLFLTDGIDTSGFLASDIKKMDELEGVVFLTYSFGDDADARLPKQIACQNKGIWYHVGPNHQIENIMAMYYSLFAAGIDSEDVRWTEYIDAVSGTPLLAGCLATYDRSTAVPTLIGVSCMDINVIVSLTTLRGKPLYGQMRSKMDAITKKCPKIMYASNTLQQLRKQANEASVCAQCDLTEEGCEVVIKPSSATGDPSGSESKTASSSDKLLPLASTLVLALAFGVAGHC